MSRPLADVISLPANSEPARTKRHTLIFFITGNPGLIEYYRSFFTSLRSHLDTITANNEHHIFDIYGRSLPGFEIETLPFTDLRKRRAERGLAHDPPYSLREVIDSVEADLRNVMEKLRRAGGDEEVDVILMGHSVGAYIALEILQRHRRRLGDGFREARVAGCICLFPTVVDIGKSERGKVLSVSADINPMNSRLLRAMNML